MNKAAIIAGVASGIVGIGIGASGQPEPEVVTETVTEEVEVIKEVEVPVEKVVESTVVPQACLEALDAAEFFADVVIQALDVAAGYPDMVMEAALAGYEEDIATIEDIGMRMEAGTAALESLNRDMEGHDFITPATACRDAQENI